MNKREKKKLEKALESYMSMIGEDAEKFKEAVDFEALYSDEDNMYEGQAILNFFTYRIKPILEGKKPGESEIKFRVRKEEWERGYHEWKFRECEGCHGTFAYALNYEGVKFCSLLCLDKALEEIGMSVTRGADIRKRWGVQYHPAIVPSSALEALKTNYEDSAEVAFVPSE